MNVRKVTSILALAVCAAACADASPPAPGDGVPAPRDVLAEQAAAAAVVDPGATVLRTIEGGAFEPLFPGRDGLKSVPVPAFELEVHPVTNAQYLAFVAAEPSWRKGRIKRLFADESYLSDWRSDLEPGPGMADRPVTSISWFAARAYAAWRGRRLPVQAEWEVAAALPLASGEDLGRSILDWYARPGTGLPGTIGSGSAAANGLLDLHGLVWEWVDDFATAMATGDARGSTDLQRSLFCGAGAIGSARPSDYAAFMRYAMRSSLRGDSTTRGMGFRCARSLGAPDGVPSCCAIEEAAVPLPDMSVHLLSHAFQDQTGAERHLADFRGRPVLMAMIYTRCSFACPAIVADCKRILERAADRKDLHVVLVSMDVERDTPAALAAFARDHALPAGRYTLLHGEHGPVRELASVLGMRYAQVEGGEFSHSNLLTLLDLEGRVASRLEGIEADPQPLLDVLGKLPLQ